ncbi:Eukaryotic translation initiation factor 2D [Symbiodinium microadriaticum]|uniref:Eukaryotic translation initiation factor 2D n=1 Tax=Symbiodinium microadriaticum TaxID=2951 RepID=A0A1Q9C8J5_SYMMI|nr:Eukaryotic translation initiation factor 2D [Symbiodinium microadriaticum]CAE7868346.1 Eif2d [Symbiodinium microadriaticum]CAE7941858.1 Eif2d [Symbiodinium sp. KB8]
MFKKGYVAQGQNLLSKKDLKALKGQLTELFPSLDEKMLDEILPEGQAKVVKLDNRCLLYSCGDAAPAFFDSEGRGEFYPTLHTLWQFPHIMQELTIHPPVSKFVLNGADLMLPGVLVPANGVAGFGTVTKGQPRCIKIDGNSYPIAVGRMVVNQTQMEKLKGKGMEVMHVYRDALWAQCGKVKPNAGFSDEEEVAPCADSNWKPGAASAEANSTAEPTSEAPAAASAATAAPGGGKAADDWTQDDLLDFTFLQAFKQGLADDKALPIEASELYEKHMKPARPEGTTLDVKKSSHKQIGKFLNAMRKSKAIDVTEKKGVIHVSKVDRKHKVFVSLEEKFAEQVAAAPVAAVAAAVTPAGLPPPKVTAMWKPSHYLEPIWKAMGKKKDELYTWDEARAIVFSYIEQEGLGKPDGPIKMSDGLLTALWKTAGGQKKDQEWPTEVDAEQVEEKLEDRLQQHAAIDVAGVGVTTRKGAPVNIAISLSRKGAHNVTRICNLEAYGLAPEALGDELKKKLNCTVYIEDMPGKNVKEKMLQLQGHVDQEFAQFLEQRYGITKKFLEVK